MYWTAVEIRKEYADAVPFHVSPDVVAVDEKGLGCEREDFKAVDSVIIVDVS